MITLDELRKWTPEEKFYRKYARMKRNPQKFQQFLSTLDAGNLIEHGLVIPELPETVPSYFMDEYAQSCAEGGLIPEKRHRCQPAFLHQHAFFLIVYVLEGKCLHASTSMEREMEPGDLCIIPPGVEHRIYIGEDDLALAFRCSVAAIRQIFVLSRFRDTNTVVAFFSANSMTGGSRNNSCLFMHTEHNEELRQLALDIYEENQNRYSQYIPALYAMFELFWAKAMRYYLSSCEVSSDLPANSLIVQAVYDYIRNAPENANLPALAQRLHYTPEYTSKLIRQQTGFTFSDLVSQAKISKAAHLLKNTNHTVGHIAELVGYRNAESFIRAFKREFHMTPTEYRKHI